MQRINRHLDYECARRHSVAHVDTGSDQQMVNTAQSWERAFIKKTNLEGGALDVALAVLPGVSPTATATVCESPALAEERPFNSVLNNPSLEGMPRNAKQLRRLNDTASRG